MVWLTQPRSVKGERLGNRQRMQLRAARAPGGLWQTWAWLDRCYHVLGTWMEEGVNT